jgi:hypothetical protein
MNRSWSGNGVRTSWCSLACTAFLLSSLTLHAQQTADPVPAISASVLKSTDSLAPLTLSARFALYRHGLTNPINLVGPAAGAAVGQWRDTPVEWKEGSAGYGRRLASGYARSMASSTIAFGVAALDHEDPRFMPSRETGIWRRTTRAIAGTFITHSDRGGRWMPAYSRFAGAYGAAFLSNAWYPRREATVGGVMERGSTALLSSIVWHVIREFMPKVGRTIIHD